MRQVIFIYFFRTSSVGGGGECAARLFYFVLFSLISRPRVGLATTDSIISEGDVFLPGDHGPDIPYCDVQIASNIFFCTN